MVAPNFFPISKSFCLFQWISEHELQSPNFELHLRPKNSSFLQPPKILSKEKFKPSFWFVLNVFNTSSPIKSESWLFRWNPSLSIPKSESIQCRVFTRTHHHYYWQPTCFIWYTYICGFLRYYLIGAANCSLMRHCTNYLVIVHMSYYLGACLFSKQTLPNLLLIHYGSDKCMHKLLRPV